MEIDLAYLWVDGDDPLWQQKKNEWLTRYNKKNSQATTTARWHNNDELKYSLRSAEKFTPWIHHIFTITDHQILRWLNPKNPKITVIDHTDILPLEFLPTFNYTAIETGLLLISGLSEYFLYANDNTFFGRAIGPEYFYNPNGNFLRDFSPEKSTFEK